MNVCVNYEALLDLYVDGELDAEEMIRVAEHLDCCPACRAYVDGAMLIRAEFPDEESIPLPEGFHTAVMTAVAAQSAPKAKKRRTFAALAPAAAACLALMVAVSGGGSRKESAPAAAPAAVQYSLTADAAAAAPAEIVPESRVLAEPAAAPQASLAYTAESCAVMDTAETECAAEERDSAYLAIRSVTEEALPHLASFEAVEYEGAPAYELSMAEYRALCDALGRAEDLSDAEGTILVTLIQD